MKLNNTDIKILSNLAFRVLLKDSMEKRKSELKRLSSECIDKIAIEKREVATNVINEFLYEDDNFCNNGCQVGLIGGWLSYESIKNKNEAKEKAIYELQNGAFGKSLTLEEAIKTVTEVKPYHNCFTMEEKLKEISLKYC